MFRHYRAWGLITSIIMTTLIATATAMTTAAVGAGRRPCGGGIGSSPPGADLGRLLVRAPEGDKQEQAEHKSEGGRDGSDVPDVTEGGLDVVVPQQDVPVAELDVEAPYPGEVHVVMEDEPSNLQNLPSPVSYSCHDILLKIQKIFTLSRGRSSLFMKKRGT